MSDIKEIYHHYSQDALPISWKKDLKGILSKIKPEELRNMEEHRLYVEILRKLRQYISEDLELYGKHFPDTIKSLLAVGEDGVYSNSLRFIYELIQNVDDCDYEDIENCKLDIKFEYDPAPGKIILTYNELGFTPFNVFSITGIAEESKNISADKVEIGEKGIGFKSVFGVADRVHIESGMFSFELLKDDFTVPIPVYDGYKPYEGTRLTIYLDSEHDAKTIHKRLLMQYIQKDAILNKNPILFLNKLTHLKMYYDDWRYIEFDVEKRKISNKKMNYEEDVIVSVDMKINYGGPGTEHKNIISCRRYTQPIKYNESDCKSRYGKDISFKERQHNLIAIFPYVDENLKHYEGAMYSFLPTQIKIAAPLVLHVPFKLDGSREYVDPQGQNSWFRHTIEELQKFLKAVYIHLAHEVKQDIVEYLPRRHVNLFKQDNEKVACLKTSELNADSFCSEPVFCCVDGSFQRARNILSFDRETKYDNPERIHELLGEKDKLFVPNNPEIDMRWFCVRIHTDVNQRLFLRGLEKSEIFEEIVSVLEKMEADVKYYSILSKIKKLELKKEHIVVIAKHKRIAQAFSALISESIEKKRLPSYSYIGSSDKSAEKTRELIQELVESADLDPLFEKYLASVDYNIMRVDVGDAAFWLGCNNAIVVSMSKPLGSFAKLSEPYDSRKTFSATLQLRQASNKLNDANENMSNSEYLKLLRGVRLSLIGAFGKKAYSSYISVINNAGTDRNRFLSELLQNADDCIYKEEVEPEFTLDFSKDKLVVSYNENGFSKDNVRAITAIGESTKKLLLNGEDKAIGEKGVGFKSVFGVAKAVDIHSNGFDFRLTGEKPTIPEKCEPLPKVDGTTMIYELKNPAEVKKIFSEGRILQMCICLRNLKKLSILGTQVCIHDEDGIRSISINGKTYDFEKILYEFTVDDDEAIIERSANHKQISPNQQICFYLPPKNYKIDKILVYSGLPIANVECFAPIIIDAPFELTTARDDIIECKWNNYVREAIYDDICELIEKKKEELRLDVFKYVRLRNENGGSSIQTFNKPYLNNYGLSKRLKEMELLPCLLSEDFVIPGTNRKIIPDIIASIVVKNPANNTLGLIIDTRHKSQYFTLLEFLGCKRSTLEEELIFIKNNAGLYLSDKKTRDALYKYLSDNHLGYTSRKLERKVTDLEIYPIRTSKGTKYVSFTDNMYTHPTQVTNDDFQILDTEVMPYETCLAIVGNEYRINQLTQEVYDARYRNNLEEIINSDRTYEEIAKYLLKEFKHNYDNFNKCKISLIGLINDIPMEMANGEYCSGNKFVNKQDLILEGPMLKYMYVSEKYRELAEYLGCEDIITIDYSDIDMDDLEELSDTDIEDIREDFDNYVDLLTGFYEDGIITDEQIEKFNLQWLAQSFESRDDDDFDEEFPEMEIADYKKLKKHIRDQFNNSPNPYVNKQRTVRVPKYALNKEAYTISMYQSRYNENKCFCQMCKKLISKTYIERNEVQKEPKYAWSQMNLSLCLTCSKDFVLLRNDDKVWAEFMEEIYDAELGDKGSYEVYIGDKSITFTATHLAEIQEILSLDFD